MQANSQFGLTPVDNSAFVSELVETGASLLKSGDCAIWDKKCQENQAILAQARLAEAQAAKSIAEGQSQNKQQTMMMIGGGVLLVLFAAMFMLKKPAA